MSCWWWTLLTYICQDIASYLIGSAKTMLRVKLQSLLISSVLLLTITISCTECLEISKGMNGLEKVILRQTHGSSAEVYLYGAHVTSWKNNQGHELLFLSNESFFEPPKPIRGGIPLCFPQFSNLGPLQSHGFARNRLWTIDTPPNVTNNTSVVHLLLKPTQEDLNIWPNRFEYRLTVALKGKGNLIMTSRIRNTNTNGSPFNFTFAYHNYFSVSNISQVQVEGLENLDYLDNLKNRTRFTDQGDAITIQSEFDKIYLSTPKKVEILDHGMKRAFTIHKHGLPDSVVWNPWEVKAKKMADFGDEEYKIMVAVESAAIEKPIILKPGKEWKFSNLGPLQSHGFARNRFWTIDTPSNVTNNTSVVHLLLKPTQEDLNIWPNRFEYRLTVALKGKGNLIMTSRIRNTNTNGSPFNFTFAYHNYFSVSNISQVQVEGLENLDYLDNLKNRTRFTDQGDAITIQSEFDKIYLSTPKKVEILDHGMKRAFTIHKHGLPDSVVWNPWEVKAKKMADFGDEEYKIMVAVESAAIEKPIILKPGKEWKVKQELLAVQSI